MPTVPVYMLSSLHVHVVGDGVCRWVCAVKGGGQLCVQARKNKHCQKKGKIVGTPSCLLSPGLCSTVVVVHHVCIVRDSVCRVGGEERCEEKELKQFQVC